MSVLYLWLQYGIPATVGKGIVWAVAKRKQIRIYRWETGALFIPFIIWYGLMLIQNRGWWRFFSYLPYAGILVALVAWMRITLDKRFTPKQAAIISLGIDCVIIILFWYFWPCMLNEECK